MPGHRKTRELATRFDRAYPDTLSDRLDWWCSVLGVDRPRFHRLLGMSPAEAAKVKDASWDELLQKKEWAEKAWWVEGKLHDLLALFDYDWHALADRLHHGADARPHEPDRVPRRQGDVVKLRYVPTNGITETLLQQLVLGGPESFPALISYLAHERSA